MNSRTRLATADGFGATTAPGRDSRERGPKKSNAKAVSPPEPISGPGSGSERNGGLELLVRFFSSLKLTVVCLGLGMVLVFWGTLAQVDLGLYKAQNEFFRSFFIYWGPKTASWRIPIFPGGYLVGALLLINLVTAHFQRFHFSRAKIGIWMVHIGLILLLLGQLLTDMLSRESMLHLREGQAKNYSESNRQCELAIVDTTEPETDKVVAVPQSRLAQHTEIRHTELPFVLRVKQFFANSALDNRNADSTEPAPASEGIGPRVVLKPLPRVTDMDHRDVPSAVVEVLNPQGASLGTWLVSEYIDRPQNFTFNNRTYEMSMRLQRFYKPLSIRLLEFHHDIYPGTDIPKNFSSRVQLQRPDTGENREVLIYMNNPLRYAGETFYQADWDKDDHGSIFQVVHNPSWLTPYLSCILVGAGLVVQFMTHLLGFTFKRRTA
ncbi:MAG TPA: cytochrome c biogenesis protein ResB [Candidatus Limnocylindrales bacterium]|jgi:hypothetical protein|nr:cytochrome c biogenesis protein ResB [Candidatus Limnocylindrales bacterium]